MAKKSSIEKNRRREKLTKQYLERRAKLKAIAHDKTKPMEERFAATLKLAELPRNSSKTRIHNRCVITLVGDREAIQEAAIRGVGKAAELIDLTFVKLLDCDDTDYAITTSTEDLG